MVGWITDLCLFGFHTAAARPGLSSTESVKATITGSTVQFDFALFVEPLNDLSLEICIVDARLSKSASVSVVLPVVVPVSLLVCPISKH